MVQEEANRDLPSRYKEIELSDILIDKMSGH